MNDRVRLGACKLVLLASGLVASGVGGTVAHADGCTEAYNAVVTVTNAAPSFEAALDGAGPATTARWEASLEACLLTEERRDARGLVMRLLGRLEAFQGKEKYRQAIAHFRSALRERLWNEDAALAVDQRIFDMLKALDDHREIIHQSQHILGRYAGQQNNRAVHRARAEAFLALDRWREAEEAYIRVAEIDYQQPDRGSEGVSAAVLRAAKLQRDHRERPSCEIIDVGRGLAANDLEAISDCLRSDTLPPLDRAELLLRRAALYAGMDDPRRAHADLDRLSRIEPMGAWARQVDLDHILFAGAEDHDSAAHRSLAFRIQDNDLRDLHYKVVDIARRYAAFLSAVANPSSGYAPDYARLSALENKAEWTRVQFVMPVVGWLRMAGHFDSALAIIDAELQDPVLSNAMRQALKLERAIVEAANGAPGRGRAALDNLQADSASGGLPAGLRQSFLMARAEMSATMQDFSAVRRDADAFFQDYGQDWWTRPVGDDVHSLAVKRAEAAIATGDYGAVEAYIDEFKALSEREGEDCLICTRLRAALAAKRGEN